MQSSISFKNDYLRLKLEYDGVVITDNMSMDALVNHYSTGDAAVMVINWG